MTRAAVRGVAGLVAALGAALVPCAGARADDADSVDWPAIGAEAAALLSGYIQIDTSNPPGREIEAARYLERFYASEGIPTQIFEPAPGRASIVARLRADDPAPGGPRPILLLSHSDVVPADPDAWSFPPFSGAIADGWVYGRGAIDDKGHGVVHALTLALLKRLDVPLRRDVVAAATAAEEAGFDLGADWMAEHHWDALGPPAVVWNEGGVSSRNALVRDRVLNAIATTEKRAMWMTLRATGAGGHGSRPEPDGAVNRLVRALDRIQDHPTPLRVTDTVDEMLNRVAAAADFPMSAAMRWLDNPLVLRLAGGRLTRDRTTNALVRDTISLTGLRAGLTHNVIPRTADAMLDVRLLPGTDSEAFLSWLRRVIDDPSIAIELEPDATVVALDEWRRRVTGEPESTVPESPVDNDLFRAIEAELAREFPESVTVPLLSTGGTDSKWFRARGVPAYGYLPALADAELIDTIHGLDERVPIAELERAIRITVRVLTRVAAAD